MKVKDVMTPKPIVLDVSMSIQDAARVLIKHRIDGAPVVEGDKLKGLFTKTHIMRAVVCGDDPVSTSVGEVMKVDVVTITTEATCEKAMRLKVGRLPVVNERGELVGILTRSDLMRAYAAEARDSLNKFNTILNSVHNAIIAVNRHGEIEIFNQAAERMIGVKAQDAIGVKVEKIFPSTEIYQQLRTGEPQYSQKITHYDKKMLSNRTPIIMDGEIIGAVAVLQDMSDLESISKELAATVELREELEAIIGSSFDGIYVTDGDGKTLRVNQAYERLTGVKGKEVIGKTMGDLVKAGVYDRSVSLLVLKEQKPVTITQEVITGKSVLVTGNPIFDQKGNIFRVVTNVRDITELNELKRQLGQAQEMEKQYNLELEQLRSVINQQCGAIAVSDQMKEVFKLASQVGMVDTTILILGESGVGKEVLAKFIHNNSQRSKGAFIKVNCGAIPEPLLESELFGYEGGSFTGAKKEGKAGIFEVANHGTLFLDEIGELSLSLQVKLLRVLAEHEITRVGGTKPVPVDVRIVVATNRKLEDMVKQGSFREDLYYRINVVPIVIPPLRSRKEDIPPLAIYFLNQFNSQYKLKKKLQYQVVERLMAYNWPGNIRELKNMIERMVVTTLDDLIEAKDIPEFLNVGARNTDNIYSDNKISVFGVMPLNDAIQEVERQIILNALKKHKSSRKIATALGVDQSTVIRKIHKFGFKLTDAPLPGVM
ncbi:MAG: sigma 54-interacting transcriptional regulator [Firmicutes bacterium]|nr:sigma 54-interacting transcriptional regulator [Bacillota bacterium]